MSVTKDQILAVAHLARLYIDDANADEYAQQFSDVLEYMDLLAEINTDDVEETNQVTGLLNVFREDVAEDYPEEKKEKIFREVPKMKDGYVVVPNPIKKHD